jgi:two-component system, OmpR family, KDP operon response regulator KdpE
MTIPAFVPVVVGPIPATNGVVDPSQAPMTITDETAAAKRKNRENRMRGCTTESVPTCQKTRPLRIAHTGCDREFIRQLDSMAYSPDDSYSSNTGLMPDAELVLIIDDEPQIRRAVRDALRDVTARVDEAANGMAGVEAATTGHPDLVLLDLGLPDMAGVDVCREIRQRSAVPIIVLSARHSEHEKVDLLNAGADDYVTKPFSVLELAARARAQIRRAKTLAAATGSLAPVTIGGLLIDSVTRKVSRNGTQLHLTPIEWQILATLIASAGRTLTHQQIFDAVWGRQFGSPQQYLRVHITNLRRKIEIDPAAPQIIITEPGVGYRAELST